MVTGRWQGNKLFHLTWDELIELHASMGKSIAAIEPLIKSGHLASK